MGHGAWSKEHRACSMEHGVWHEACRMDVWLTYDMEPKGMSSDAKGRLVMSRDGKRWARVRDKMDGDAQGGVGC